MDADLDLPKDFVATITATFDDGAAWLRTLPARLADCAQRYELTIGEPFSLSYNYVTAATRADGRPVVLKLGVPNPELATEILALQRYGGSGVVELLAADADRGVLLLERLLPGEMLTTLGDDVAATAIAATLMRRLWQPVEADHPFHTVADWGQRGMRELRAQFDGGTGPFDPTLVALAEECFVAAADSADHVLLHGDLHHENVLSALREPWIVIDPKGVVGPRGYECGTYLRNHLLTKPDPVRVNARRVTQLAEILGLTRAEVLRWGVAHNVLSAWWSYDGGEIAGSDALLCAAFCAQELDVDD